MHEAVSIAAAHPAPTSAPTRERVYSRRKPEDTLLYKAVETYLPEFLAFARERSGRELPKYVVQAFEHYLDCGRLDRGFTRLKCGRCSHEFAVGFSCRDRGICPSCGQRRMKHAS
mgnify:CR=1